MTWRNFIARKWRQRSGEDIELALVIAFVVAASSFAWYRIGVTLRPFLEHK